MEFRSISMNWTRWIPNLALIRDRYTFPRIFTFCGIPAIYPNEGQENREGQMCNFYRFAVHLWFFFTTCRPLIPRGNKKEAACVYIYIYIACINLCWLGECRSLFTRYIRLVTCKRWVERGRPRLIPGEYGILMKRRISPIASIDFANRGNPRIGGGFLKKKIERIKKEKR